MPRDENWKSWLAYRELWEMEANMLRLCCLPAICLLVLTVGSANADTVFNVSGTINSDFPPPDTSTLSGTITINTGTGAIDGVDLQFTSPSTTIAGLLPDLTNVGIETSGTIDQTYEVEVCASVPCSSNWLITMLLDVPSFTSGELTSLVGYDGGDIYSIGLFYGGVQDTWGSCQADSLSSPTCGQLSGAGPVSTPEPAVLPLVVTSLAMIVLLACRKTRKSAAVAS
jgi:hypothetical protein